MERKTIILLSGVTHDDEEERHIQSSSSVEGGKLKRSALWREHDSRKNYLNDKARRPTNNVRANALNLALEYKQMPHLNRREDPLHFLHSKADKTKQLKKLFSINQKKFLHPSNIGSI